MQKSELRRLFSEKRSAIKPAEHAQWSKACCTHLVDYVRSFSKQPSVISGYIPIGSELNILPALEALAASYTLVLPVVAPDTRILAFRRWQPGDELISGPLGTREPLKTAAQTTPDLLIVPLLAYGHKGERLGYGKGYYDATLAQLGSPAKTIGIAFSLQYCAEIPISLHDTLLNKIITEQGL